MSHNTKAILVDVNGRPIPQYFNPITDQYEPLYGVAGAARSVLYGPDGQPISASNRLPVDVGGTVDISDRADRQLGQVTLSGSLPGVRPPEIETILNAVSVPPGGATGFTLIDFKGCRKALLAVNCDQPWRMMSNSLWGSNAPEADGKHLYPNTVSSVDQSPFTSPNYPQVIVVGAYISRSGSTVTSYDTALARAELPANFQVNIYNQSTENTATIRLRVMRIW